VGVSHNGVKTVGSFDVEIRSVRYCSVGMTEVGPSVKIVGFFAVRGAVSLNKNEKKPQKNEKTPHIFFVEDIDNIAEKCYN